MEFNTYDLEETNEKLDTIIENQKQIYQSGDNTLQEIKNNTNNAVALLACIAILIAANMIHHIFDATYKKGY